MWNWVEAYQLNYIFRILVAGICGLLLGLERQRRSKQAGIRTHCVVACAAALMMIVSKYAFFDLVGAGMHEGINVNLDPSRVAANIASGIGFLGAGMILIHRTTVSGLTTAAGVWATSGIGMAIGGGMYLVGICATGLLLIVQFVLHGRKFSPEAYRSKVFRVYDVDTEEYPDILRGELEEMGVHINEMAVAKNLEGRFDYTFYLEMPNYAKDVKIVSGCPYRCMIDVAK